MSATTSTTASTAAAGPIVVTTGRPAAEDATRVLRTLGVEVGGPGGDLAARSPIDGRDICALSGSTVADVDDALTRATDAFVAWRRVPSG